MKITFTKSQYILFLLWKRIYVSVQTDVKCDGNKFIYNGQIWPVNILNACYNIIRGKFNNSTSLSEY